MDSSIFARLKQSIQLFLWIGLPLSIFIIQQVGFPSEFASVASLPSHVEAVTLGPGPPGSEPEGPDIAEEFLSSKYRVLHVQKHPFAPYTLIVATERATAFCEDGSRCYQDTQCGRSSTCYFFLEPDYDVDASPTAQFVGSWKGSLHVLDFDSIAFVDESTIEFRSRFGDAGYGSTAQLVLDTKSQEFTKNFETSISYYESNAYFRFEDDRFSGPAWSHDSARLSIASKNRVWILDAHFPYERLHQLISPTTLEGSLALNGNGTLVAAITKQDTIQIWVVEAEEILTTLASSPELSTPRFAAFIPNRSLLAVVTSVNNSTHTVALYDTETFEVTATYTESSWPGSLSVSPDGRYLAVTVHGRRCNRGVSGPVVYDLETEGAFRFSSTVAVSADFHPDGKTLVVGRYVGGDCTPSQRDIEYWDLDTRAKQFTVPDAQSGVALDHHPDETSFTTAHDGMVYIWDAQTLDESHAIEVPDGIPSATFSPDGSVLSYRSDGFLGLIPTSTWSESKSD